MADWNENASPRPRALEERIASAWCRIVGEEVPSSSVRSETSPIAACCPRAIAASEPRRLPPRRRREVGQRAAPEAAALTCVYFLSPSGPRILGPVSHYVRDLWRT